MSVLPEGPVVLPFKSEKLRCRPCTVQCSVFPVGLLEKLTLSSALQLLSGCWHGGTRMCSGAVSHLLWCVAPPLPPQQQLSSSAQALPRHHCSPTSFPYTTPYHQPHTAAVRTQLLRPPHLPPAVLSCLPADREGDVLDYIQFNKFTAFGGSLKHAKCPHVPAGDEVAYPEAIHMYPFDFAPQCEVRRAASPAAAPEAIRRRTQCSSSCSRQPAAGRVPRAAAATAAGEPGCSCSRSRQSPAAAGNSSRSSSYTCGESWQQQPVACRRCWRQGLTAAAAWQLAPAAAFVAAAAAAAQQAYR